ncbi:beta-galactosidase GalA [Sphingomonas hengshuiensis]|uniref:beta-galactosidase GalA n=1 Tax=Sphingomonas hengshuiensis TaxID=1609977 RepID=UPI0006991667|nr:beta-galactosidase GalA [Sphingomonas hengshuiensis]
MTGPASTRRGFLGGSAAAGGMAATGLPMPLAATPAIAKSPRETLSLDGGWRFHEGDIPFPPILDHEAAYAHAKAGNAEGAAASDYDDGDWRRVALPHDWALGQPFDAAANIDQGYRRRGIGWYRRTFALAPEDRDRALELRFDGIATHATLWINGTLAHRQFGGFTGFTIDLSPFALYGDDLNTLAIRVDADATEGWWYEGAGIYRHVWLIKRAPVHIVSDGVHADPRRDPAGQWRVPVTVALRNSGDAAAGVTASVRLTGPDGEPAGGATTTLTIPPAGSATASVSLAVASPQLWSPDGPALYRVETRLVQDGAVVDATETRIGFRTLRFDADHGFFLNDQPLKIRGACAHQDHAGVGVAVPDSLWDFRLRRLKAMGANALRCAHNPPAPELLDAADRLGVMILNEHRELSAAADILERLAFLVRRDRNHPSVILWSLCNEESLQSSGIGVAMVRRMKAVVRALDDSRPITAALNGAMFASPNIAGELDVVGFNYGTAQFDRFHAAFPDMPLLSSEDTSAYMTRGAATTDRAAHVLADDDSEHAGWGLTHRAAWAAVADRPFLAGGFFWTGFDYRGEPTPFEWPSVGSFFGAMDLCGFAKSGFHIRRALWSDAPVLELWPHWNWAGREGQPVPLLAITNAERVVLRLNGRVVADLLLAGDVLARATLAYAPGVLEAIGYRDGRPVAHRRIETAGPPVALRLTPDRATLAGDGRDTVPVTVEAIDARGRAVPVAQDAIGFHITGGTILGVGNGDPNSHESDLPEADGTRARRRLFNGLAQILVQAPGAGPVLLTAQADGLRPATLKLTASAGAQPTVPPLDGRQQLTEWRVAPASATPPEPNRALAAGDMNSWAWLKPGTVEPGNPEARFVVFRLTFTSRAAVSARGGQLLFASLAGAARVSLDGQQVAAKTDPSPARLSIPLPAGSGAHVLEILFDSGGTTTPFGLAGSVSVLPAR